MVLEIFYNYKGITEIINISQLQAMCQPTVTTLQATLVQEWYKCHGSN